MSETCPKCSGDKVVGGDCVSFNGWRGSRFELAGSRYVIPRTTVNLSEPMFACVGCGFVWSQVPANELQRLVDAVEREAAAGEVDLMQFATDGSQRDADRTRAADESA